MKNNNPHYTRESLLRDEKFLRWRYFPTEEDILFWEELRKDPAIRTEIDAALKTLETVRFNAYALSDEESETMLETIENRINHKQLRVKKWIYAASTVAAAAIVALAVIFFVPPLNNEDINLPANRPDLSALIDNKTDIQLVIGEETVTIEQDADFLYNESGEITITANNKEVLKNRSLEEVKQNRLIVPRGKRSSLTLSDGSKIWINSGSVLEFPATFPDDKREITVEGEIFIEVAPNKDRPFFVNTPQMSVRVLGTTFNISAYREDANSSVVLVEGKVEVLSGTDKVILKPDEMASIKENQIDINKVDVSEYICWKEGYMQFTREPLSSIATRLMRYYNRTIICQDGVEALSCTGKLILFDNLEDVIKTISNTNPIEYTKTDEIIYIRKKTGK